MGMTGKQSAGDYTKFRLVDFNGGLNTSATPTAIADNELQDMDNLVITEAGVLKKRFGLRRMNPEETQSTVDPNIGIDFSNPDVDIASPNGLTALEEP